MEVTKYIVEVIKWEESPWESYADLNANMSFGLVLSPPDKDEPAYSYFAVHPQLKITNGGGHTVFIGETKSTLRLTNNGLPPQPEVLFEIIEDAAREFAKIFLERTIHNPHIHHPIPRPLFKNLQAIIEECIEEAYSKK
jgi:hypothetical protein